MLIRSIVTLLALLFSACLLPVYGQEFANLPSNVPLQYTPLPIPCRAADTRVGIGQFGNGPAPIAAGTAQVFDPAGGGCNIPLPAFGSIVYAMNVTVIPHGPLGYLTVWPYPAAQPVVSTLNSEDGEVKANAALVAGASNYSPESFQPEAGPNVDYGLIYAYASDTTDLVLDVTGYFSVNAAANLYVPVTPCRVVDTRTSNGTFGAPALVAGLQRSFLLADSSCNLPAAEMAAVSLNVTAIPIDGGSVNYLTVWGTNPSSPETPTISTLNAPTGAITANAAIVTINQGTYGSVSVYASNDTNLVMDVTGYFVPAASAPTGLSLSAVTPCRVLDTRLSTGVFQGELTVPFTTGNDCNVPTDAQAYVVNATVVPTGPLDFLTLWPDGTPQPLVSTLNATDGLVASNMAVVGTTDGSIDAYASNPTQLILDLTDSFAEVPFASASQPTVVFAGDQILAGEVQYANNPYWIFNPTISGYIGSCCVDSIAASFGNVLTMNPRPNVAVIQFGNVDYLTGMYGDPAPPSCGGDLDVYGLCGDWYIMVGEATAAGMNVITGNLLPFGPNVAGYTASSVSAEDVQITTVNQYMSGLLGQYHPTVLDFNTALGNGSGGYNPLYSDDGVSPNAAGYAVMTTMIQAAITSGVPEVKKGRQQ